MTTTSDATLPVLGAALTLDHLPGLLDWVMEHDRDLELQDFVDVALLTGDTSPTVARYRDLLAGHKGRIGIHGPFWDLPIAASDPDIRAVVQSRFLQALDGGEALGATHMVIHSPFTNWSHHNMPADRDGRSRIIDCAHKTLAPVVARAEAIGCTLVIENIEDREPDDRIALARSFDSDQVRVSLDTGHAHYAHVSTGGRPVDYHVRAAGSLLAHVHVQDVDGYADRHWAPGDGTIRWAPVFREIAKSCENPRLILELLDPNDIPRGAQHLVDLGVAI
ncbi:sugar phosphate isomerase/epimerase [Stappia sp. ES.058]|uniref:sugar phosphate isomerase/epimerase family protein n=1 Tax=Stappia sp. ES.058 TaxID=1881061 RepID=UPI00087A381F|nr:sugar phosphate isomerase/epimerase family protein [Stappia sp. ES.058]SDT99853.1 Sugar phosphate isomerase/epimerase [Stappia sp. ES.058]